MQVRDPESRLEDVLCFSQEYLFAQKHEAFVYHEALRLPSFRALSNRFPLPLLEISAILGSYFGQRSFHFCNKVPASQERVSIRPRRHVSINHPNSQFRPISVHSEDVFIPAFRHFAAATTYKNGRPEIVMRFFRIPAHLLAVVVQQNHDKVIPLQARVPSF